MSDKFPKPSGDCITDRMRQNRAEAKAKSELAPANGSDKYCPLESLDKEIQRFRSTNQFSPMLVTNFYAQAACVVTELKQTRELIKRLSEWDKRYPKGSIHSFDGERQLDLIMTEAHFLKRRYPNS